MRCPKSCGTMFEEMDSFICWQCSTRVWKDFSIVQPMTAPKEEKVCWGCERPGVQIQHVDIGLCNRCENRQAKGWPFIGPIPKRPTYGSKQQWVGRRTA